MAEHRALAAAGRAAGVQDRRELVGAALRRRVPVAVHRGALQLGLVHAVVADAEVEACVRQRAQAMAGLSPQAARINKRSLRQIAAGGPTPPERRAHFDYAASAEHREGVMAFIEKRRPRFGAD